LTFFAIDSIFESEVHSEANVRRIVSHSEVSNDSNTSHDLSGLSNFQKDLDEIKISLRDVTTKDDLNEMTKDLDKTSDLENIVTGIVKKLFSKFESSLEKKMNEKNHKNSE
jgi:hypothetical protein